MPGAIGAGAFWTGMRKVVGGPLARGRGGSPPGQPSLAGPSAGGAEDGRWSACWSWRCRWRRSRFCGWTGDPGIRLAQTGFGLPLAVHLLRAPMVGPPREVVAGARVDGARAFRIFRRIIRPLSFPALARFAIFQSLWVSNDLLVATVFLGNTREQLVMTGLLRDLVGSRGGEWQILATLAFISIAVPLLAVLAMQKYLVHGLLAGSVKGG